jgi:hypothetical protein
MTWHPLALSIWLLDFLSWLVFISAAWRLIAVLTLWQPGSWEHTQLMNEARLETAALMGRWLVILQSISLVLYVIGVSICWPDYVPGAMCGTGVLQAMGPSGRQTLILRLATVLLLFIWRFIQDLEDSRAEHLPTTLAARLLLLAGPLLLVCALTFARALSAVQPDQPVSCCTLLFERMATRTPALISFSLTAAQWNSLTTAGGLVVAGWGFFQWHRPLGASLWQNAIGCGLTCSWVVVAAAALKYNVAPYVYGALWHPCLWCMFLPVHGGLGFVFFGLLCLILVANTCMLAGGVATIRMPALHCAARSAVARTGWVTFAASLVFLVLMAAPAVVWRVRSGTWLSVF